MNQFLLETWKIICELAPWLLLGMLLSGLMHAWLPTDFIRKKFRGVSGVFKAVGLGVPLPLCSCGVIPAGIGLKNQGASNGAAIGFLISTPQTGVDSILVSAAFLGWPFAFFKMASAAVLGVIGGLLADQVDWKPDANPGHRALDAGPDRSVIPPAGPSRGSLPVLMSVPPEPKPSEPSPSRQTVLVRMLVDVLQHGLGILRSIWLWLLIGVLISAGIETLIPSNWLALVGKAGLFWSMLLVLVISIPLYVCATASVPIAATIVQGGFPPAAALVFLIAGPATNVTTIGAVYSRFGWRVLTIYLGTIIVGSMLFAVLFHWTITTGVANTQHHHQHGESWLEIMSGALISGLLVYFAAQSLRRSLSRVLAGK